MRISILAYALIGACAWAPAAKSNTPSHAVAEFFKSEAEVVPQLRTLPSLHDTHAIQIRQALDEAFYLGKLDALNAIVGAYPDDFELHHPGLVELVSIFENSFDDGELSRDALRSALEAFESPADWYAEVYARTRLSMLHVRKMEILLAGQRAQEASDRIPNAVSRLVSDAHLVLAEQVIHLYGVSANPDRMLEASRTSRELHAQLGIDFNRYELMTNFLLAYNWKRDHASAAAMAEMIAAEPRPDGTLEGLAEVYTADMLNETEQYEAALAMAQKAGTATDPFVQRRSLGEAMIALAGLGRVDDALGYMRELGFTDADGFTARAETSEGALHARSLLAANSGRPLEAVALMNRRLDLMIGRLREANAADTAALLGHLENTRERQREREAALQREAELKAVQLQQKTRINRMLWAALGVLMMAVFALLGFIRYRGRLNRKVSALQDEALSAEKMKTEFLGVINHELRTPLNGVIGISEALIQHNRDPDVKEKAQTIQDCGQNLFDLVESLIDMSTIEGGKMEIVPDRTVLKDIIADEAARWNRFADKKGLAYTQFYGPELSRPVDADSNRIRQCARILLSNGIRFTDQGRVHLHATGKEVDGQLHVTLIVADTGQGISEAVQARLFKPFLQADSTMTRKHGGAGLNLAIARKLARMMGGDVTLTSAVDRGSEFVFTATVPLMADSAPATLDEQARKREARRLRAERAMIELRKAKAAQAGDGAGEKGSFAASPDVVLGAIAAAEASLSDSEPSGEPMSADEIVSAMTDASLPEKAPGEDMDPMELVDLMIGEATAFDEAPQQPGAKASARDGLAGRRILIVEDLPSNQDVIRLMLEPEGCQCLCADDAASALRLLSVERFDAVVMDIHMPGMDGVEATRTLRQGGGANATLPVIALTADAEPGTHVRATAAGIDHFLTKPVIARELLGVLRSVLGPEERSRQSSA